MKPNTKQTETPSLTNYILKECHNEDMQKEERPFYPSEGSLGVPFFALVLFARIKIPARIMKNEDDMHATPMTRITIGLLKSKLKEFSISRPIGLRVNRAVPTEQQNHNATDVIGG